MRANDVATDGPPGSVAGFLNTLPIALMSGGFVGPLAIFWLQVWGPLRPLDTPPVPHPPLWALLLGMLASAAPAWLPDAYYRPSPLESRRLYERFGVRWFRRFVPDGDIVNRARRRHAPDYRVVRNRVEAVAFLERAHRSESSHLVLLVAGVVSAAWATRVGWHGWALFIHVGNLLVNLYPVLLQRYTRLRIARLAA